RRFGTGRSFVYAPRDERSPPRAAGDDRLASREGSEDATSRRSADMTRRTNARIAGVTYLAYIAVALPATNLFDKAANGQGTAAKLAGLAQHASDVRVAAILGLLSCFAALVLAVTLYAITRDEDRDLALLALSCRLGEGVLNALHLVATLCLLWLATERGAGDSAGADALGGFLLKGRSFSETISANFFAVGSTLFSWLLLRGRIVPAPLTWLGVAS